MWPFSAGRHLLQQPGSSGTTTSSRRSFAECESAVSLESELSVANARRADRPRGPEKGMLRCWPLFVGPLAPWSPLGRFCVLRVRRSQFSWGYAVRSMRRLH
eukprot:1434169-Prymnesium_polylepis.2